MEFIGSYAFQHWAVQFLVVLFLFGSLLAFGVGLGLIVDSARTLRFCGAMNRWVSSRRALRPLEIPRNMGRFVQTHRRWFALLFVAGAVFALYGVGAKFDAKTVSFIFGAAPSSVVASWLIDSIHWALIVGNVVAIAIGIMLGFFPVALIALEARGARWYSERQFVKGADEMHLTLDRWVAAFPRLTGWIVGLVGFVLACDFIAMIFEFR